MYLRVTRRKNRDGSVVRYYQLAENRWDPVKRSSVARVIYNFGRADQVDHATLRRLAQSILRVVREDGESVHTEEGAELKVLDAWPLGGIWVVEQLYRQLGLDKILIERAGTKRSARRQVVAIFAMIANRTLAPCSKLYCWEQWLREDVFLPKARELELHDLYLGLDLLEAHKVEIEKAVYFSMADLVNVDVDLIFYDTTSLHFEVDEEDEIDMGKRGRKYPAPRKRGYSKNGRDDAPQVVVGLAVTRDGLPVRSWVFPGNTADVVTVAKVKEDLRGWRLGRCVFVGDAGMNSEENRRKLSLGGGKYILASRIRGGGEITNEVLTRPGRFRKVKNNLRVKEVIVGDGERRRRYVLCHNPEEEARQQKHREKLLEELVLELESLGALEDNRRGHTKRVCELRASKRYGRFLKQDDQGRLLVDLDAVETAKRYDGKWVITSNDDTLSAEDLALGYKQLLRVEQCWRQLKSGLRLRPVFHWVPWRIQAHVSLTVLALLIERIAEIRCGDTWRNILDQLKTLKVVSYERDGIRVHQTTEPRPDVQKLLRLLQVNPPPKLHAVEPVPATHSVPVSSVAETAADA